MKRFVILLVLYIVSSIGYAQPSSLDETFGKKGMVVASQGGDGEFAFKVVVLPNDNILQIGCTLPPNVEYELIITHLTPDGDFDDAFGNNGRCRYPSLTGSLIYKSKAQLYPDGRLLIYGLFTSGSNSLYPFVARILANGILDSSFGVYGIYQEPDPIFNGQFASLSIRKDGSIIALGYRGDSSNYQPTITMLTNTGKRDAAFGVDGRITIETAFKSLLVNDAYIDKNNKCIFGTSPLESSHFDICIIRTDLNGAPDLYFGDNGVATVSLSDNNDDLASMCELPNGKVLCMTNMRGEIPSNTKLVQLESDGTIDESFGDWGSTQIHLEKLSGYGYECILDHNGKIIIAGAAYDSLTTYLPTIFRCLSDGEPDPSFGVLGVEMINKYINGEARAVDLQSDGKYIFTGWVYDTQSGKYCNATFRVKNTISGINRNDTLHHFAISLHPTPSSDNCTVTYTLPTSSDCSLTVRDESGRAVKTFMTSEFRAAGKHEDELDLRGLASGVYFLSLEHNGKIETAKVVVSH
ncbi:MAG TPA: T9SS type A sorting domain-containing protein [Candidatus Kapabacteria bacterium]